MQKEIETVKENNFHKLYLSLKHQHLRRDDLHVFLGNNFWKIPILKVLERIRR